MDSLSEVVGHYDDWRIAAGWFSCDGDEDVFVT